MVVPLLTPSMKTSTVLFAAAVPVKVGVVSLVLSSVLEEPVSLPAARSGVPGAAGAAVSTVTDSPPLATEVLPPASVAVAVTV